MKFFIFALVHTKFIPEFIIIGPIARPAANQFLAEIAWRRDFPLTVANSYQFYLKAIEVLPCFVDAYFGLLKCCLGDFSGQLPDGRRYFEKAKELNSDYMPSFIKFENFQIGKAWRCDGLPVFVPTEICDSE